MLLATVHAGAHSSVMIVWIICGWPEWSCALQAPQQSTKITVMATLRTQLKL